MTYQETLTYIYGLGRFGMRPGLEKITALLQALGNPQNCIRTVHVAGTNGKGSTAAFLAAIIKAGGLRTGLYTSPHLVRFTERIRVGGTEIAESEVVRLVERVVAGAPEGTTFFELVTAMAFLHFAEQGVELAVMEVGMGGRLDATNAADASLAVITPVAIDHSAYLGESVAAIAAEKAGIVRPGRPVVISTQCREALVVIEGRCTELASPFYQCGEDFSAQWEDGGLVYRGLRRALGDLKPGIGGRYQAANAACALAAAELLADMGYGLSDTALRLGIETASWPGRMELIGDSPRVILDGAHNPAGALALAAALADVPRRRLVLVAGVMGDKDAAGIMAPLLPLADRVIAVAPALERAMPAAELAAFCGERGVPSSAAGSVAEGVSEARQAAGPSDLVLVCGSLFTVGEARAFLLAQPFEPFRG